MKAHRSLLVAVMSLLLCLPVSGEAIPYTFTKIADTNGGFSNFVNGVAIANNGTVAFTAFFDGGGAGVFTSDGITTTTIAETLGGTFTGFNQPSINNLGTVAVKAAGPGFNDQSIITGDGTSITTIADNRGSFNFFGTIPSINDLEEVAFTAVFDAGGSGIFLNSGGSLKPIIDTSGIFSSFGGEPGLNNSGTVVFRGIFDVGGEGIFTSTGSGFNTIADNDTIVPPIGTLERFGGGNSGPSFNDGGAIVFAAGLSGNSGIFIADGGSITTLIDEDNSPFNAGPSSLNVISNPFINNNGTVTFLAYPDIGGGRYGIFTGTDPIADKVILTGDSLFGSTVVQLDFLQGLNDKGQVAFRAELADGTTGIYRADPVVSSPIPEPKAGEFAISAFPTEATATAGGTAIYELKLEGTDGFDGLIVLSATELPSGEATFQPNRVTLSPSKPLATSQLTLNLPNNISSGAYSFRIFATAETGQVNGVLLKLRVFKGDPIQEISAFGVRNFTPPLNIRAGTFFNLVFDRISITGKVSIFSNDQGVFGRDFSSNSGTISGGPYQVTLDPGEYLLVETYSGRVQSSNTLVRVPNLTVSGDVTVVRRFSVISNTTYTIKINTVVRDFKPHGFGPVTISSDIDGIIGDSIPIKLTFTESAPKDQQIRLGIGLNATLVSDTTIEPSDGLPPPIRTRTLVEVTEGSFDEMAAQVRVENIQGLFGFQFDFRFDPQILEAVGVDEGNFLKRGGGNTFWNPPQMDNSAGTLTGFIGTRLTGGGVSGSGTLATIRFKPKQAGTSRLELRNVKLSDEPGNQISTSVQSGSVDIPPPVSATLKVTPQIDDTFVVAGVQLIDAVNVESFSVDLVFPAGLEPVTVGSGTVEGNVIRGITAVSRFKFQIYEGGDLQFVLRNGTLTGTSGHTAVPTLMSGAITVVASPVWDVNRDYRVDIFDLVLMVQHLNQRIPSNPRPNPDVNRDGIVDIFDFVRVATHFGEVYSPIPGQAAPPIAASLLNPRDVDYGSQLPFLQQLAVEIHRHPLAHTPEFVQTRALLAKLIALAGGIPDETRLLTNYPNPFNPETWIPFRLAQNAEVAITIYNIHGRVIRTLALGMLPAGSYESRNTAAYWNGRDEVGELVSSGLYFYRLRADDFSAVKRMVILK